MTYSIIQEDNITHIAINSNTKWGTICFSWEDSNEEFINALNSKGINLFIDLLIANPDTAYLIFIEP
jgi:hypothetical protein